MYLSVSSWLTSFSIINLGLSILLQMALFHSFLWLSNIPLFILYMYHIFFIHSSVDGHLGCFHVLAIVYCAAMNIRVHIFFELWVSLERCPRVGLLGYMVEKCKSKLPWGTTLNWPEWPSSKRLQITNAEEGVEKREPSDTVGGNVNWCNYYGEQCGDYLNN